MTNKFRNLGRRVAPCACAALLVLFVLAGRLFATGDRGVAATIHPLATDAAIRAMKDGGNAIDAAVAAALTLGVEIGRASCRERVYVLV